MGGYPTGFVHEKVDLLPLICLMKASSPHYVVGIQESYLYAFPFVSVKFSQLLHVRIEH